MYFPYLRGKQFELIALREIAPIISGSDTVNPVLEPVKKKTTTYVKSLEVLQQHNINFTIVINPVVGDKKGDISYVCSNLLPTNGYDNYQIGIIIRNNTDLNEISIRLTEFTLDNHPIVFILDSIMDDDFDELLQFISQYNIYKIFTGPQLSSRRKHLRELRKLSDELVYFSDVFTKQQRNKDYKRDTDEFFSDEHIYYTDDGFKGYSDFITIGKEYADSGFSPYAVAIHLTYPNGENEFRIHHFVSESNDDFYDVAGKFEEALEKLIPFLKEVIIGTKACEEFRKLSVSGKYPGLGTIKKLSILNHLELVHNYFTKK